jgi:hypothetical protein
MNNFVEEQFREAVWDSKIPVKIDMALEDINDVEKPGTLYVIESFLKLVPPSKNRIHSQYNKGCQDKL